MGGILEKISDAIKEFLMGLIESNLTNMFTDVNDKVGTIATEVGKTPSSWNGSIYTMVKGLSDNVIVPMYAMYMSTLGNREDLFPSSSYVSKYITNPPDDYEVPAAYLDDATFNTLITEGWRFFAVAWAISPIGIPFIATFLIELLGACNDRLKGI